MLWSAFQDRIRLDKNRLPALLCIALFLMPLVSGCGTGTTVKSPGGRSGAPKKSALPVVDPEFPGAYQTVEQDGVQFRRGRYRTGKFGGTLVRSLIGADPKTFNPWAATDTTSSDIANLMFASLLTTDMYNGETIPYMAESFQVGKDGITYFTRLRAGLKWSDGQPITADDVAFTWNTIVAGGYGNASLRDITAVDGKAPEVTVVDNLTNKYVTARPFAPFLRAMGDIPIAPRHIIEPVIKAKDGRKKFDGFWPVTVTPASLVTSGPFRLQSMVSGQRVEFSRNESFFMVDHEGKRLPYLDRVVYQIVPDVQTNLLKFKSGELDLTQIRSRDTAELLSLRKSSNFELYNLGQAQGTVFLMFNLNRRKNEKGDFYVDPVTSAWFNDVNFRQAVNHAINRDTMVANYFRGLGYPSFTMISPTSPFFDAGLAEFEPNPQYALSLLAKSGFKKNKEGLLEDRDGNKVEFDLVTASGSTFLPTISNMLIEDLRKLGMKVNFQEINFNILMDKVHTACNWQAAVYGLSGGDPFEPNNSANVFRSDARLHLFDQRQPDATGVIKADDARLWEKHLDDLFAQGTATFDRSKRKAIYDEIQKTIYDQAPFIYLVSPMTVIGARNTIQNYAPTKLSQTSSGLHNIEEIWKEDQ
ncbi:MAG: ABC transporter substrate-binding protein [Cyanobacteria bacterium HKST-UBA02]|nr:ABC transporter substrate-binding protein [Cyanobacteria bacterium HKST-UBA02]